MSSSMWASNLTKTIKHILSMKQFDLYSHINHIIYTELFLQYIFAYYSPRKQSLGDKRIMVKEVLATQAFIGSMMRVKVTLLILQV
jgi:hypothetical protein